MEHVIGALTILHALVLTRFGWVSQDILEEELALAFERDV